MIKQKTPKKKPVSFPFNVTQTIIVLLVVIIGVMAYAMYSYQRGNESVQQSLAEQSFNQYIMIQQLIACNEDDSLSCKVIDSDTGQTLPMK